MKHNKSIDKKWKQNISFRSIVIILAVLIVIFLAVEQLSIAMQKQQRTDQVIENDSLKRALELSTNDYCITKEEALALNTLNLTSGVILDSFDELGIFSNVEKIMIKESTLCSLKGIDKLKKLKVLYIESSVIEDASEIRNLELEQLSLKDCNLDNTISLGSMPNLIVLDLSDNTLQTLEGDFPNLISLKLSNNKFLTLEDMCIPENLQELGLNGNPIKSIAGIEKYKNIKTLSIMRTDIVDVSVIVKMENINALYIDEEDMCDSLEVLYDNFRNGDRSRKIEYLSRIYNIHVE